MTWLVFSGVRFSKGFGHRVVGSVDYAVICETKEQARAEAVAASLASGACSASTVDLAADPYWLARVIAMGWRAENQARPPNIKVVGTTAHFPPSASTERAP